jgi:hypothetical protein
MGVIWPRYVAKSPWIDPSTNEFPKVMVELLKVSDPTGVKFSEMVAA